MKFKVQHDEYGNSFITMDVKVEVCFPLGFENIPDEVTLAQAVELLDEMDLSHIGASVHEKLNVCYPELNEVNDEENSSID